VAAMDVEDAPVAASGVGGQSHDGAAFLVGVGEATASGMASGEETCSSNSDRGGNDDIGSAGSAFVASDIGGAGVDAGATGHGALRSSFKSPAEGLSMPCRSIPPVTASEEEIPARLRSKSLDYGTSGITAACQEYALPGTSAEVLQPAHGVLDSSPEDAECRGKGPWHRWHEAELPKVDSQAGQVLRVFCGIWNLHGKSAPADISAWVLTRPRHHIYVIGTCECERSIEKSMIWASKARWEQQVRSHLGEDYFMIGSHNMSAIHVMVFLHRYIWRYCWDIKTGQVATGLGNLIGNKGGTQVGFNLGRTSLLFVNAHLAAHAGKMKERTQSLTRIFCDSPIRRDKAKGGVHEDYDRVFFMGDLNARVEARRSEVDAWLAERQLCKCLERDQLLPLMNGAPGVQAENLIGLWPLFEEAAIKFPPTYKFDAHTDRYDTSKKQRVPSWTDRILWKRDPSIRSMAYSSVESLQYSDHLPVFSQFEVTVDLDKWDGPKQEYERRADGKSMACSIQ